MINVAGAFRKSNILRIFVMQNKNIDMCFYDGVDYCRWNGGRINNDTFFDAKIFDFYNNYNKGVYLTFSNRFIDDLNDARCNDLLHILNTNSINGVILCNDDLRKHIRDRYPKLNLIYSITGHPSDITINDKLIDYLKDLESKYDLIVPRFEWTFNKEFYSNINPKKYEIMVNDTCKYGCTLFREHFDAINNLNRIYGNPHKTIPVDELKRVHECWLPNFDPEKGSEHDRKKYGDCLGMDLSPLAVKNAKKIGYDNWKIMGRENNDEQFKKDLYWYTKILK